MGRVPLLRRAALALCAAGGATLVGFEARPDAARATLRAAARAGGLVSGTAVQAAALRQDPALRALVAREAEILVPEWEAKWAPLQPQEGRFDFAALHELAAIAAGAGQFLRGHCLLWHVGNPPWLDAALAEGPLRARGVLEDHVGTVLAATAPSIRDWDVVNEPLANAPGSDNPSPFPGDLRATPWLRALGPDYVEVALRTARAADRTLRLTLNDYGLEADTPWAAEKRARLLRLVRALLDRGAPLDAVGIQGHLQMREPFHPEPFLLFLRELRALGLALLVTELDVREPDALAPTEAARDAAVAARVERFLGAAIEGGARTVLSWGLTDRDSWLRTTPEVQRRDGARTRGLPFDDALRPKPMHAAMLRAFGRAR